jgi:minor curlin subunit
MKHYLILGLSSLAAAIIIQPARAQGHSITSAAQLLVEEIGLERLPGASTALLPTAARTLSVLRQTGDRNVADIEQVSLGGTPNQAFIVQAGNANVVDFSQFGNGNAAALILTGNRNTGNIDQRQTANSFESDILGNRNTVNLLQDGNNNRSILNVEGNNRTYGVTQVGNNNNLVQQEGLGTSAPRGYNVEMRGNGINMTITQGRVQP